jgi:hypothetical protein
MDKSGDEVTQPFPVHLGFSRGRGRGAVHVADVSFESSHFLFMPPSSANPLQGLVSGHRKEPGQEPGLTPVRRDLLQKKEEDLLAEI